MEALSANKPWRRAAVRAFSLGLSGRAGMPVLLLAGLSNREPTLAAPVTSPLRVSEVNPRYFADESGKAVYLAGAHDGWESQDYAWGDQNPGVLFSTGRVSWTSSLSTTTT